METQVITRELHKGIFVHRKIVDSQTQIFTVQNDLFNILEFVADFTGSTGIFLPNPSSQIISARVPPKTLGELVTVSTAKDWNMQTKFRFTIRPPPKEQALAVVLKETQEIKQKLKISEDGLRYNPINTISIDLFSSLLQGNSFVDPYFPPDDSSIFLGTKESLETPVHWRRATDLFPEGYEIFSGNIEPNDIKQGMLGDCWFMSALASLAERPQLIRRLFLKDRVNDEGIYRVRLCKNGEWVIVTVDDYFPCFPNESPIFSRSHGNELWVLILEKAYAKLHGSYMLLKKGWPVEGLIDLTGCPTVSYELTKPEVMIMIERDELWPMIKRYDIEGAMIIASTVGEDRWSETGSIELAGGLVPGHAYTVIQAIDAKGNRLLNIRNPWGHFEWDGDWSDNSPLWTPEMIKAVKPVLDGNDGTFWMSYNDFIKYFYAVNICKASHFYEGRLKGKFLRVNLDGKSTVISRWYYTLEISEPTKLYIGIHQEDERIFGVRKRRRYIDIGIVILKSKQNSEPRVLHYQRNMQDRQIEMEVDLGPGSYIVLPRTTGCRLARPVYVKSGKQIPLITGNSLHPLVKSTLRDIFRRFDLLISEDLSYNEMKALMETIGEKLSIQDFDNLKTKYCSTQRGITFEGFQDYFYDLIIKRGEVQTWSILEKLGYDNDLYSTRTRGFVLTLHSNKALKFQVRDALYSNLDKITTLQLLKQFGKLKLNREDLELYHLSEE
jgi:calpain-15